MLLLFCYGLISGREPGGEDQTARDPQAWFLKSGKSLIKGIAEGPYKKPGWREYLVRDRIELEVDYPPKLMPHPRLLTPFQIRQATMSLSTDPQRKWYSQVRSNATQSTILARRKTRQIAEQAKSCAFVYRMEGNPYYLNQAISLLRGLPEPPGIVNLEGGNSEGRWGDYLQSAEAIPALCVACDLLYNELPDAEKREIERKIAGVVRQLAEGFQVTPRNNHVTVMAVAVATAALTFDNLQQFIPYSSRDLFRLAIDHLSQSLSLIAPDGGYGEGPYYARYILNYLSPFSIYLRNNTEMRLFRQPRLMRMISWIIDNDKGNNTYTQFDDSYQTNFFFLPLISDNSRYKSLVDDYLLTRTDDTVFSSNMPEAVSVYQVGTGFREPAPYYPGRFYPDLGQIVFRNRLMKPDFFMSMTAENQRWFSDTHEQIDPLSLEITWQGADFVVDGGYGRGTRDAERPYFLSPQANSTVLVDGFGISSNPLIGDASGADIHYAFSTSHFAGAVVSMQIGDAMVQRQMYYDGKSTLLMLDQMEGGSKHRYAVQYQTPADYKMLPGAQMRLEAEGASMDLAILSTSNDSWTLLPAYGLGTVPGGLVEHNTLQFQTEPDFKKELVTLWSGYDSQNPVSFSYTPLKSGQGEWRRRYDRFGNSDDIVYNYGDTVATPLWAGNAKLLWIKCFAGGALNAFLLTGGTYFRMQNFELLLSRPASVYLERSGSGWSGYIDYEKTDEPLLVEMHGSTALPVLSNGTILSPEISGNKMAFSISSPGVLQIGPSPLQVHIAEQYHPETDVLERIAHRPMIRQSYDSWSPYEKTIFKNEISWNLAEGIDQVFRRWSYSIMRDSLAANNFINVTQGLLQYNYNPSRTSFGFRLPHEYYDRFGGDNFNVGFREQGEWRQDGLNLRQLWLTGRFAPELDLSYRYQHLYEGYQGFQVNANWRRRWRLLIADTRGQNSRIQSYQVAVERPDWNVIPQGEWKNDRLSRLNLRARIYDVYSGFGMESIGTNRDYFQFLSGMTSKNLNWVFQGRQSSGGSQRYDAALAGLLPGYTAYSLSLNTAYQDQWSLSGGELGISRQWKRAAIYQNVLYQQPDYVWSGGISGYGNGGSWNLNYLWNSGNMNDADILSFRIDRLLAHEMIWNSRWVYTSQSFLGGYDVSAAQSLSLPLDTGTRFYPLWEAALSDDIATKAVGAGISSIHIFPFYLQLLYRKGKPLDLFQGDFSLSFPLDRDNFLNFYGTALFSADLLNYIEMRILQSGKQSYSPGIYINYSRGYELRMEGALEWKW